VTGSPFNEADLLRLFRLYNKAASGWSDGLEHLARERDRRRARQLRGPIPGVWHVVAVYDADARAVARTEWMRHP
jgi:hypothetical protein